ncbi:type I-U CRISPR-associated protein Csb2 [Trebonia sp.]|uniref:type I-G CRISPR-associated protein Csb2 n=1 Tax=Trebonia sp. TaxID=2767075 RepID=UPI00262A4FD9|nr:type I-U CRISPR-associated protein Csb2 [Trebonia sp.]
MFAIAVELLAGRYTATQFNDRSQPEWPPHPARLFSALVAAWADSEEPDPGERAALRWLEDQGAPDIHCGEDHWRTVVTHYVPVNDATALIRDVSSSTYEPVESARQAVADAQRSGDEKATQRALVALTKAEAKAVADAAKAGALTGHETASMAIGVLEVLPENRGKQGRTYPTIIPDRPTVWFVWPTAQASGQDRGALDALLGRVARIGHSSTLVACRCDETGPESKPAWVPGGSAGEARRVRVPRTGLIDRLELAFQMHHGEEPRTLPAGMVNYHQPRQARTQARRPRLGGDWYVLGFTERKFPAATQVLAVARATRNALLTHGVQPSPEILSGHQRQPGGSGPTPPLERPHLAVVPLLNAGNPHSDGTIYGVALVLPAECPAEDRRAVEGALRTWATVGDHDEFKLTLPARSDGRSAHYTLADLGVDRSKAGSEPQWLNTALTDRRKTTTRDYWCRPAKRWLTVTPIALDRFPGNLRSPKPEARDRAEAEAAAVVARACVNAGLADRPEDVKVTIRLDAPLVGIPASPAGRNTPGQRQFPGFQTGGGVPRACVHAEIEFPEPVRGPVLIGAGRYLGYGLCLPRDQKPEAK